MKIKSFNKEVLFADDPVVRVDAFDIDGLKKKAKLNKRKRIRLCAHKGHEDSIHEMLIVHDKMCYVRPHKHLNKTESFHIIEGLADIVLFGEDGQINNVIPMGDYATGRKFFYRLPQSCYHTLLIRSEVLVFHEITNGPFRPEDTVWALWAPEEKDEVAVLEYMEWISSNLD